MATINAVDEQAVDEVGNGSGSQRQMRHLPLSRIIVPDGFNPRGEVEDDRELEQMAESIRRDGCLQPIRVRATEQATTS